MTRVSNQLGVLGRARGHPIVVAFVAIVVAAIVAGVIVAATSGSSSPKSGASSAAAPSSGAASSGTTVQAVSAATLAALPASVGHPVFWAGPRQGAIYELTTTPDGRVYVRYLSGGARVGSPLPNFLTVGTYVVPNAEAAVRAAAGQPGSVSVPLRGGVAFYNRARPTSVYFAYAGSRVQISNT